MAQILALMRKIMNLKKFTEYDKNGNKISEGFIIKTWESDEMVPPASRIDRDCDALDILTLSQLLGLAK